MSEFENIPEVLTGKDAFENLSEKVNVLKQAGDQLLDVMEDQVEAVISADAERLIQTTEKNVAEQQNFFNAEQGLIKALAGCVPYNGHQKKSISFELLKVHQPGKASQLDLWKQEISDMIDLLQTRQGQLFELLQFAQSRNADMMRSFYELQTGAHVHYRNNGERAGPVSGMAINQEV